MTCFLMIGLRHWTAVLTSTVFIPDQTIVVIIVLLWDAVVAETRTWHTFSTCGTKDQNSCIASGVIKRKVSIACILGDMWDLTNCIVLRYYWIQGGS